MRRSTAAVTATVTALAAACGGAPGPQASPRPSPTLAGPSPLAAGSRTLADLHMVSASVGWAVAEVTGESPPPGRRAHVVRTTDGGARWTTVLSDGRQPVDTDVHDADHAWVLEVDAGGSAPGAQTVLVRSTADGGRSWSTTPPLHLGGTASHLQFADAAHGWVFATSQSEVVNGVSRAVLHRTVDGGTTWQPITALPAACPGDGPVSAPTFADAQHGWLGAFCNRVFLHTTGDGGVTWVPQPLPGFPGPPSSAPAEVLLYSTDPPQFTSPSEGAVVVHRGITSGANALQDAALLVTHDGGATWSAHRLPAAELQAGLLDPDHGWMVGAGPGGDAETRSLYTTRDGGATWSRVSGPQDYLAGSISFVTPAEGFIGGSSGPASAGLLLHTTDGGARWTAIPTAVP
ncbi:MAG: hypothetical protein QOG45_2121 [Chloroflexota bacterium]|nr:hypothetical protein [Chloroflexota bacterium]